jgi:Kelch motif protein
MRRTLFAVLVAVLLGPNVAISPSAAEQRPGEMIVAMASSKSICGGNTGKVCPGTAPALTPPVAASPVIPAPKPPLTTVTPTPPASTTAPVPAPTLPSVTTPVSPLSPTISSVPTAHPMVTATLLGQTGEDVVGTFSGTPDGIKDVHIKLSGVSGTIKGVRITGLEGIWETPANGKNWLVAIRPQSDPSVVDLYFDYFKVVSSYMVTLTFSDGATQAFQAATNNPGSIYLAAPAPAPTAPTNPTPAPVTSSPPAASPTPAPVIGSGKLAVLTVDPANGGVGFQRAHWVTSINKMVIPFGSQTEHSIRALDPVTNTWDYLWPKDAGGLQSRDNQASFYVPQRDEIWLWGGSHLEVYATQLPGSSGTVVDGPVTADNYTWWKIDYDSGPDGWSKAQDLAKTGNRIQVTIPTVVYLSPSIYAGQAGPALWAGRFSIAQKRWVATGAEANGGVDAFAGVIKNFGGFLIDPGTAWSAQANMGMLFGGSDGGNSSNRYWIIEPNSGGPEPYKMAEVIGGGVRPPIRAQCMNCLVAVGKDFYLFGGTSGGFEGALKDLWKFDTTSRTWTQLPDAPRGSYTPAVTYDSDRNAVVAWVYESLYVFDIASGRWSDQTPAGLPCIFNQVGAYAPTVKAHLYEGGNKCADGSSPGAGIFAVSVNGQAIATPPSATTTNPPVAASASTGHIPLGYLDTISSDGSAQGWSYDPDVSSQSNDVQIYADGPSGSGTFIAMITANASRPDVNSGLSVTGNHGFSFSIPANLKDGKSHQLYIYGIDKTGDGNFLLTGSPKSFAIGGSPTTSTTSPTAPPASTVVPQLPISGSGSIGGLNIPLRTWVARSFPTIQNSPGGASVGSNGSKHLRFATSFTTGLVYELGGDYSATVTSWLGLWSYDMVRDQWQLAYPWCGNPGEAMLGSRDELGWVWDSKRSLFWALPGFVYPTSNFSCNGGAEPLYGTIMTFDPATGKYANPGAAVEPINGQKPKNGIYDPATDSIYRAGTGNSGLVWDVYHISSNTWDQYGTPCATGSAPSGPCAGGGLAYINDVDLGFEYIAADLAHRKIYAIDPIYYRLLQFDMDQHTVTIKAAIPEPDPARVAQARSRVWTLSDLTQVAFDSINNVLFYSYWGYADGAVTLLIYHPDTDTWETDTMFQPDGLKVRGNSVAFNPVTNALMIFGGLCGSDTDPVCGKSHGIGGADPSLNNFFLYRYGNGK